jgi:hypothetical protein
VWTIADAFWDVGALAFVVGTTSAVAIWRQADLPDVAETDPLFTASLRYDAH